MGNPYTSVSVSGYNANPPPDDGSQVAANRVLWSTIKTKLSDTLKTAIESINANIGTGFGKVVGGSGITSTAVTYVVQSGDQGKLIVATVSGIVITTPDATDVGEPFVFNLLNNSTGSITLNGPGQFIDGVGTITVPAGNGLTIYTNGTAWFTAGRNFANLPAGHLHGLTMSNAADTVNDITIAAGRCRDSSNTVDLVFASAFTKQIDSSWVVGTNVGGRSSAGLADDTWHVFAIGKALGTNADFLFHNTVDPTSVLPTGYLYYRRIGSVIRSGATLLGFIQFGNEFWLKTNILDYGAAPGNTTPTNRTISVPNDINVCALMNVSFTVAGTNGGAYIFSPDLTDQTPSNTIAPLQTIGALIGGGNPVQVAAQARSWTNTSSQVRVTALNSSTTIYIVTLGWIDHRGKES